MRCRLLRRRRAVLGLAVKILLLLGFSEMATGEKNSETVDFCTQHVSLSSWPGG